MRGTPFQTAPLVSPSTISPTQVTSACGLRSILGRAVPKEAQLPPAPQALFGTLVHNVIEACYKQQPRGLDQVSAIWLSARDALKTQIQQLPLQAGLVNFTESVPDGAVKKALLLQRMVTRFGNELLPNASPAVDLLTVSVGGVEVWLKDATSTVIGRADSLKRQPAGWEIRDYKTGRVLTPEGTVRPEYVSQLHLYAALVRDQYGEWPARLVLEDENGTEYDIAPDPQAATGLLAAARGRLATWQAAVEAGEAATLAVFNGPACIRCAVRHACGTHRRTLAGAVTPVEGWADLAGTLSAVQSVPGGVRVGLRSGSGSFSVVATGTTAPRLRQAVAGLEGSEVLLTGLRLQGSPPIFTAASVTTLWPADALPAAV